MSPRQDSSQRASCACRVAKFLEARGLTEKALEVAKDADYRFELALQLDKIDTAVAIAEELGSDTRWKQLGVRRSCGLCLRVWC